MNYFEMKKRAFMNIVNSLKGFIRKVSGVPPLTLPDCVDSDSLISYSIEGDGVGDIAEDGNYKIPIKMSGKNLFDPDLFVSANNFKYIGKGEYKFYADGYGSNYRFLNLKLPADKAYTISASYLSQNINMLIRFFDENDNNISATSGSGTYLDFYKGRYIPFSNLKQTVRANSSVAYYMIGFAASGTAGWIYINNIQLEEGKEATEYEAYIDSITTNIIIDERLIAGDVLEYPKDNIPKLPTTKGTTIYTIETEVQPSNMSVEYYSTRKD